MSPKAGWSTPMLHVAEVERSIRFYRLLGFEPVDAEGDDLLPPRPAPAGLLSRIASNHVQNDHSRGLLCLAGPEHRRANAYGYVVWSEFSGVASGDAFAVGIIARVVFGIANL